MKRVLLAYSGGLDTSFLVAWLVHHEGFDVHAICVDCGGFDEESRAEIQSRALLMGATTARMIDGRKDLHDSVLRWLIAGNVRRGDVYPLSVGAERGVQAQLLAELALEEGFDALAHGCTAAGNDQVRFEAALAVVASELEVMAPVRDMGMAREAQVAWLKEKGFPVPPSGGRYSMNAGLWGLTIGGGEMLDTNEALPEEAWVWTRGGVGEAHLSLRFEGGVPCAFDGKVMDPVALIEALNTFGGGLGVGRGYHLGDTVLGIKGRIAFEAPAAEILITAHRELEKLVLTEDQRFWKDHLGEVYGRRLHQGLLHDPFMRDVEAFLASSQAVVEGTVHIQLSGGRVIVTGVQSSHSMLAASDAAYGEKAAAGSDPRGPAFLGRILAEPARLSAVAKKLAARSPS
ncbi:MAG: argininosuccinate synthase [Candidatus Paceibacteria bacterium]|jgi:argininosuccinate synthase